MISLVSWNYIFDRCVYFNSQTTLNNFIWLFWSGDCSKEWLPKLIRRGFRCDENCFNKLNRKTVGLGSYSAFPWLSFLFFSLSRGSWGRSIFLVWLLEYLGFLKILPSVMGEFSCVESWVEPGGLLSILEFFFFFFFLPLFFLQDEMQTSSLADEQEGVLFFSPCM